MRLVGAALLLTAGVLMVLGAERQAATIQSSNESRYAEHDWRTTDWRAWNRFVCRLVGAVMIVAAVLAASGLIA